MAQSSTDFLSLAAATAVFGVAVVIVQNFVGWLRTAGISARKGEPVPVSIEAIFGKTGLVVVMLIVGLVVVPLVFGLAEYALYIGGFFVLIAGVMAAVYLLFRSALGKIVKITLGVVAPAA